MNNVNLLKYNKSDNFFHTPWYVHIEITENCRAKCSQCYVSKENGRDMPWPFLQDVLYRLSEMGVPSVILTGGDPLEYPYLIDAVCLSKKLEMASVIISSGIGLNNEMCLNLKNAGLNEFHISLNGSSEEINDLSRSNYFDAINAIKIIKSLQMNCTVSWVARRDNLDDLTNLIELCKKLKVDRIFVLKNKKNCFGVIDSELSQNDLLKLKDIIYDCFQENYITIDACYIELSVLLTTKKIPTLLQQCTGGINHFDILVDGKFSPCRKTHIIEAATNVNEYWNNAKGLNKKRKHGHVRICQ